MLPMPSTAKQSAGLLAPCEPAPPGAKLSPRPKTPACETVTAGDRIYREARLLWVSDEEGTAGIRSVIDGDGTLSIDDLPRALWIEAQEWLAAAAQRAKKGAA